MRGFEKEEPLEPGTPAGIGAERGVSHSCHFSIDGDKQFHAPQHSTAPEAPATKQKRSKSLGNVLKGGRSVKGRGFS